MAAGSRPAKGPKPVEEAETPGATGSVSVTDDQDPADVSVKDEQEPAVNVSVKDEQEPAVNVSVKDEQWEEVSVIEKDDQPGPHPPTQQHNLLEDEVVPPCSNWKLFVVVKLSCRH